MGNIEKQDNEKALELLKELNKLSNYGGGLPQKLLDKISFKSYHSQVIVGLQHNFSKLEFVFVLTISYDGIEIKHLSIEEVAKIMDK